MCRWTLFSLFAVLIINQINADVCEDTKPDFSAPGRRASDQKCREYNWERKQLEKCSKDAVNMRYPYVGALGYKKKAEDSRTESEWSFLCASFLISPKFVVTTAHCLVPFNRGPPEIVRFGNDNIQDKVPRLDIKILGSIIHPQYKPPSKSFDIALAELESEVPLSRNTYPACLWSKTALDGVEYGSNPAWGTDKIHGKQRKLIEEMKVKVIDQNTCLELAKSWYTRRFNKLEDHHICGNESVSTILNCQGSAGAPLITTVELDGKSEDQMPYAFGMSDFGKQCGTIGIYVRISSFTDWIEQNVWPKEAGSQIHFRE